MTNILVTGITGFIGSNLSAKLVSKGYKVYGLVRHSASRTFQGLEPILQDLTLLSGDLRDYHSVKEALRKSDPNIIIHLGAMTPVRLSFEDPLGYQEINYVGTVNLVCALTELPHYRQRRIIAASTGEVYGIQDKNEPFVEDLPLKPSSPYAVSKAAMDMYLRMAMNVYHLNCTLIRAANTFGRKYETGFFIEYVITSMLEGEPVWVGAPKSVRDYMYVDDHVKAFLTVVEKIDAADAGRVFNVGTGKGVTNGELAVRIGKLVGCDPKNVCLGSYPTGYPTRPIDSDQPYLVLNASKIERELGWMPAITLDEGLERTIGWWRSRVSK